MMMAGTVHTRTSPLGAISTSQGTRNNTWRRLGCHSCIGTTSIYRCIPSFGGGQAAVSTLQYPGGTALMAKNSPLPNVRTVEVGKPRPREHSATPCRAWKWAMGGPTPTLACAPAGCSRRSRGWGQSEPPGCLSSFQQPHPPNSMSQTKFIMVCMSLEVEKFGGPGSRTREATGCSQAPHECDD